MKLLLAGEDRFGQGPFLSIGEDAYEVVGFANTPDEAVELASSLQPDAVLLELGMSDIARRLSRFATVVILSHSVPHPAAADGELAYTAASSFINAALALATATPSV
jgi:DNA-binding NarL/FixJ family response regulator